MDYGAIFGQYLPNITRKYANRDQLKNINIGPENGGGETKHCLSPKGEKVGVNMFPPSPPNCVHVMSNKA